MNKITFLLCSALMFLFASCSQESDTFSIRKNRWYESRTGYAFMFKSSGEYHVKHAEENIGLQGSFEEVSNGRFYVRPADGSKGRVFFASSSQIIQSDGERFKIGGYEKPSFEPEPEPVVKQDLIEDFWYLTEDKSLGYLFRSDKKVEKLVDGKSTGLFGEYKFNKYKQELSVTAFNKAVVSFEMGESEDLIKEGEQVFEKKDFLVPVIVKTNTWYLSDNARYGYYFHEDGSYSQVKNKTIVNKVGKTVPLANGSFMLVDTTGTEVQAFKFNGGDKVVINRQSFNVNNQPTLGKAELSKLVDSLKALKVTYKSSYSFAKLLSFVEKKKASLNKVPVSSVNVASQIKKFKNFYDYEEESSKVYFYAGENENFGTRTPYGFYKGQEDGKYVFIKSIAKRGFKTKSYYYNYSSHKKYLHEAIKKAYSAEQLSKDILHKIDPSFAENIAKKRNAKLESMITACGKALPLLQEGAYLESLAKFK